MRKNETINHLRQLIIEQHGILMKALDDFRRGLAGEDRNAKIHLAGVAKSEVDKLSQLLPTSMIPIWINKLQSSLDSYIKSYHVTQSNLNERSESISCIFGLDAAESISQQRLDEAISSLFTSNVPPLDFDAIFEQYKSKSNLDALFDDIIHVLEKIEASGEVDSMAMLSGLNKIISTINKSKKGSYFSLSSAWDFLLSFLKNYMWAELSKIPALGSLMEALEKAIKETNQEMVNVHNGMRTHVQNEFESVHKGLQNKAASMFDGYDKSGLIDEMTAKTTIQLSA